MKKHLYKMNILKITLTITLAIVASGCAYRGASELVEDRFTNLTNGEYYIPKFPVDKHYIGYSWSKSRKKVFRSSSEGIDVVVHNSFSGMHDDIVNSALISASATPVGIPASGSMVAGMNKSKYLKVSGVQLIRPLESDFSRIPFDLGVPYITEAIRVQGFEIANKGGSRLGIAGVAGTAKGEVGGQVALSGAEDKGVSGEGLVIGYKFEMLDVDTLEVESYGPIKSVLDMKQSLSGVEVVTELVKVAPSRPLSNHGLIWACSYDRLKQSKYLAAWVFKIKFERGGERVLLPIAFPALSKTNDLLCNSFDAVLSTNFSAQKDKHTRNKIKIKIHKARVNYNLRPVSWDVDIEVVDEAFRTKTVDVN